MNICKKERYINTKNILIFIILNFVYLNSFSQEPINIHYTIDDGLPSNEIYHVLKDSKGFMWFASDNGVSRYNGYNFEIFNIKDGLSENTIFYMYEDYKKRIWFISYNCQLSYYYKDSIYEYKYNYILNDILLDNTRIWKKSFFVDSTDNIYFGTNKQGIFKIDTNGFFINKTNQTNIQIEINDNNIITASKSPLQRNILVTDGKNKFSFKMIKASGWFISLKIDSNRLLFSNGNGIHDIKNKHLSKVYTYNDDIPWISSDKDSNIWVSLFKNGVNCYKNLNLDTNPIKYLPQKTVTSVLSEKDGSLWFTTLQGVYYYPNTKVITINSDNILSTKKITAITNGKDNEIWFSTYNSNIYKLNGRKITKFESHNQGIINTLFYDKLSNSIIYGGLREFGYIKNNKRKPNILKNKIYIKKIINFNDTIQWYISEDIGRILNKNKLIIDKKISNIKLMSIFYNNGHLYLGTKNGLWLYFNKKLTFLGKKNKLLQSRIDYITNDSKNNLWLATRGNGIIIINKDSIFNITTKEGLSSNSATTIFIKNNIAWVGTMNGLNKINIKDLDNHNYNIHNIYKHHGLASNLIFNIASHNDTLYVGTERGLSFFNINKFKINKNPPPIYFKKILISEKDTNIISAYNLKYYQNSIGIEFICINYKNQGHINYKYRLIGTEKDWIKTKNTIVRYPSLEPGRYTFEIIVENEDGVWSKTPAKLIFIISKPYWQTFWFKFSILSGIIIIISLILLIIYKIKLTEIKKRSKLLENLTNLRQEALAQQMNPHFIFNTLSSIQYFISENDKKSSTKYLTMFSHLMRLTLNNSYKRYITIDEEIKAIELYIKLEQLRFNDGFKYKIEVDEKINTSKYMIPSLLLQPFVENSIWHGLMQKDDNNGLVEINIKQLDDLLQISIIDNGIGRKKSKEINYKKNKTHKSLGSKITESRLKLINKSNKNDLQIKYKDILDNSNIVKGTIVEITIPITCNY